MKKWRSIDNDDEDDNDNVNDINDQWRKAMVLKY